MDGKAAFESELGVFVYDPSQGQWLELDSTVNPEKNQLVASTSHFSLFAVGVSPNGHQTKVNGHANQDNWFGCELATNGGNARSLLPLLALLAGFVFARFAVRARR